MPASQHPRHRYHGASKPRSLWLHALWAFILLAAVVSGIAAAVTVLGKASDAIPEQRIALSPLPGLDDPNMLNSQNGTLPDLLGDSVPEGVNPTDTGPQIDALGNPIGGGLAGGNDNQNSPQTPVVMSGAVGLMPAPISALQKNSPFGPIPTIASDGRKAVTLYARPARVAPGTQPVALIIGGLGINRALTERAINELPADVTLSFAAHARDLQSQINAARAKGHEVLLELPMESTIFNADEPGADRALRVTGDNPKVSNLRNLDWLLSRAGGYFGVTNYNGDAFLMRSDAVVPIMSRLSDSGLGFVFDGSSQAPSLPTLSSASALPFAKGFTLIDETAERGFILDALSALTAEAQAGRAPIGIGFTYAQTLDSVKAYTDGLAALNLSLVPASAMLKDRG